MASQDLSRTNSADSSSAGITQDNVGDADNGADATNPKDPDGSDTLGDNCNPSSKNTADSSTEGSTRDHIGNDDGNADANVFSNQEDADGSDELGDVVDLMDSGSEPEDPNCGEKRKRSQVKARQLKAHEVKLVLDEWARRKQVAASSDKPPPSKGALLKWAKEKLHRPKLQRLQLNRWLNNEDKYIAAASNGVHSTQRRLLHVLLALAIIQKWRVNWPTSFVTYDYRVFQ